ncbi:MAG: hypothetical protein QGI10_08330 [Vicinamibacterales bacterium]|jgi:hypothetical protein|nr:hypothetical protein [Vicinamibacterales bacterium]MDP7479262.1 hypothetical protein [Vicinamibacterales bacterium]HJN45426.1 hypothetical protein [Vicinamibacterales bacterium]|tara:strand:- start:238 stop:411 length:174 start_codon:yes stop_codon:yes gene_type:complete
MGGRTGKRSSAGAKGKTKTIGKKSMKKVRGGFFDVFTEVSATGAKKPVKSTTKLGRE